MEERKDAAYFKKLAEQLMFRLTDEEAEWIKKEFDTLMDQLHLLDAVDTEDTEEMIWPFEDETTFMREDTVTHVISQEDALANVTTKIEGHFALPKVVMKDD
ncbi:MAG: Asp-tRNA(Asn)/Glu-tRNA(Gln) amidotransferase subunit GatC [Solobacterium sp.]|nr:Asp-tRNA(Asn)/Glu-tRNA(Gln) amidotransferase subunit GatC [Solobacterium sp.]